MKAARLRSLGAISDGFQSYEAYEVTGEGFIEAMNVSSPVPVRIGEKVVFWHGPDGSRFLQRRLDRNGKTLKAFHLGVVPRELSEILRKKKKGTRARKRVRSP